MKKEVMNNVTNCLEAMMELHFRETEYVKQGQIYKFESLLENSENVLSGYMKSFHTYLSKSWRIKVVPDVNRLKNSSEPCLLNELKICVQMDEDAILKCCRNNKWDKKIKRLCNHNGKKGRQKKMRRKTLS